MSRSRMFAYPEDSPVSGGHLERVFVIDFRIGQLDLGELRLHELVICMKAEVEVKIWFITRKGRKFHLHAESFFPPPVGASTGTGGTSTVAGVGSTFSGAGETGVSATTLVVGAAALALLVCLVLGILEEGIWRIKTVDLLRLL
jgi:hypothetical protein